MPTAIITGANGGIGSVLCRDLRRHFSVVGLWHTKIDQEIPNVKYRQVDLVSALQGDLDKLMRFYKPSLLVCAHAFRPVIAPSGDVTVHDWMNLHDTDVHAAFRLCQAAYTSMCATGGSIVLLSSIHALGTFPERTVYAAAKAAVCSLARSLAVEWGRYGIRVNAIAPGQVEGRRTQDIAASLGPDVLEYMRQRVPNRQFVQPEDIARTVLWLAETPAVNGQTIVLDHGMSVNMWYGGFSDETQAKSAAGSDASLTERRS